MEAPSHIVRRTITAVITFALILSVIAVIAGAGIAVVAAIVLAGMALPLLILAAIRRDEIPVERLAKKTHHITRAL